MKKYFSSFSLLLAGALFISTEAIATGIDQYVAVTTRPYFHPAYEFEDGRAGGWCADTALFEVTEDDVQQVSIESKLRAGQLQNVSLDLTGYPETETMVETFDQYDGRRTFCVPYILRGPKLSQLSASTRFVFNKDGQPIELISIKSEAEAVPGFH